MNSNCVLPKRVKKKKKKKEQKRKTQTGSKRKRVSKLALNEESKYSMLLYILLMAGAIGAFINIPFKERFYTTFIEYIKICEPIKSF